jgi:hypothetical protein
MEGTSDMTDITALTGRRPATQEELRAHLDYYLKFKRVVRFRHGVSEQSCRRAKSGVRHVRYSAAKPRELADGQIVVNHHGKPEVLVATASTWDIDGTLKTYIVDVRLAGVSLSW